MFALADRPPSSVSRRSKAAVRGRPPAVTADAKGGKAHGPGSSGRSTRRRFLRPSTAARSRSRLALLVEANPVAVGGAVADRFHPGCHRASPRAVRARWQATHQSSAWVEADPTAEARDPEPGLGSAAFEPPGGRPLGSCRSAPWRRRGRRACTRQPITQIGPRPTRGRRRPANRALVGGPSPSGQRRAAPSNCRHRSGRASASSTVPAARVPRRGVNGQLRFEVRPARVPRPGDVRYWPAK